MRIFCVLLVLLATRAARAEDLVSYQADGDADAKAADARVEALDEAFAKAVSQAVNDVVDADVRKQNKPAIDREIIGHARLWVAKFTVTKEAVADDRKQLSVSVRVDRDKVRARLGELNIAIKGSGDAPPGSVPVAVLLRVVAPEGVRATFGLQAEKDIPGLAALGSSLRGANYAIKRAPASGPAAKADGDLPLDDDTAEALAAEAKADVAAIASVAVGPPGPLRGIPTDGVLVAARVRLVDRKAHKALGQGLAVTAARGSDPGVVGYAIDHALVSAMADVLPPSPAKLAQAQTFSGTDTPIGEPGVVLVRLARQTPWGIVQAELKHLTGAKGVAKAALRHVSPAGWVIGVTTSESIDRVAAIVKKPPATDTHVTVKIVDNIVEASLEGAP